MQREFIGTADADTGEAPLSSLPLDGGGAGRGCAARSHGPSRCIGHHPHLNPPPSRWRKGTIGRLRPAALLPVVLALLLAVAPAPARADHESSEPSDGTVGSFRWLSPPRQPPAFQLYDAEGRTLTMADFRGRVMLMNIWATWCAPCIREMPALDRLQAKFDKTDFVIVPVSIDKEGLPVVKAFYERLKLRHLETFVDPEKQIEIAFPVDVLPANFLFDGRGRAVAYLRSFADWDAPEAEALIRAMVERETGQ